MCDASGEEFPIHQKQKIKTLEVKLPGIKGSIRIDIKKELIQGVLKQSGEVAVLVTGTQDNGTRVYEDNVMGIVREVDGLVNIASADEFAPSEISSIETAISHRLEQK